MPAGRGRVPRLPLCRSLWEDDAFSPMAGLAGADAEVSLAHPLLPTLPPYPQKQRDGHYGPLLRKGSDVPVKPARS